MSQESPLGWLTYAAEADFSAAADRYKALKAGAAARGVALSAAAADIVIGFLQNSPISGALASVAGVPGTTCKARAGGTITAWDRVKLDTSGRVITGGAGADRNWGIALSAAAVGDVVEILLTGLIVT